MSGDVFSSMDEKENLKYITSKGRINITMDVNKWCGRKAGPCDIALDLSGYYLCFFCKYKRKFDIPKIVEKEKIRKNGNG